MAPHAPLVRFDLGNLPKYTSDQEYVNAANSILQEYPGHSQCFTDGSKIKNHSALAYSINNELFSLRLSNLASIFTAELSAIFLCLQEITQRVASTNYVLVSDSLSSLQAITDPYSSHPLVQRILLLHHSIASSNISIVFLWAPGHVGLAKGDIVDKAAKRATKLPKINCTLRPPASDFKNEIKSSIQSNWSQTWKNLTNNKLLHIKKSPIPWTSSKRPTRRQEIVITRLRIGHTKLTHSHLLSRLFPPDCPKCGAENLSVDHLFTCPALAQLRTYHKIPSDSHRSLANSSNLVSRVILYLQSANLYNLI